MAKPSLLDLMISDQSNGRGADVKPEPVEDERPKLKSRPSAKEVAELAARLDAQRREEGIARARAEEMEAIQRSARRAANRPPEICGFREGHRFDMSQCGPEIDGRWVVIRVDPGPDGDQSRLLVAQRTSGAAGYLQFTERKLQDLLHFRVLSRLD